MANGLGLLHRAYGDVSALLRDLGDDEAVRPSGCSGWAVLDLAQHLVFDARRGLVATATPTGSPPSTDAVGYWRSWQQSSADLAGRMRAVGADVDDVVLDGAPHSFFDRSFAEHAEACTTSWEHLLALTEGIARSASTPAAG